MSYNWCVIDNDTLLLQLGNILNGISGGIYPDHMMAGGQNINGSDIVIVHIHCVQIPESGKTLDFRQLVVRGVEGNEGAILSPLGKRLDLIVRDIEVLQINKSGKRGNIQDSIACQQGNLGGSGSVLCGWPLEQLVQRYAVPQRERAVPSPAYTARDTHKQ